MATSVGYASNEIERSRVSFGNEGIFLRLRKDLFLRIQLLYAVALKRRYVVETAKPNRRVFCGGRSEKNEQIRIARSS